MKPRRRAPALVPSAALAAILCALLATLAPQPAAASCDDPRPLRLALIPKSQGEALVAQYRPLLDELERTLARRVDIVPTPSYGTVVEGLLAGHIDLAELGPATYATALERGAAITAFASFRQHAGPTTASPSSYHSMLITRRGRGAGGVDGLRGATLSLTDPGSTSGAVLPRDAIARLTGSALEHHFGRITFSGTHGRAIEAVRTAAVDAAFVSSSRIDEAIRLGHLQRDDIDVVWTSAPIPYDPFVHRTRLCPALKAQIAAVFFGDAPALRPMFAALGMSGFAAVDDSHYREIRDLLGRAPR